MATSLQRGEARLYAQRYIIKGIRDGLSGNQVLQNLRSVTIGESSLGYRTETFYQDYNRYAKNIEDVTLRGTARIPGSLSSMITFDIPSAKTPGNRYNYPVIIHGVNKDTGEPIDLNFSFNSPVKILDDLLPNAVQSAWDNLDKKPQSDIEFNPEDIEYLDSRHFYEEQLFP